MREAAPSFGIVVLNWNNGPDTLECLEALEGCDPPPTCIVVVDNGSKDDSLSHIREWQRNRLRENGSHESDWLTIISAGSNLGFSGGNNLGIEHLMRATRVTHVMLLNNDATVPPAFFTDLRNAVDEASGAGIIGPTIRERPDTDRIWYAGGTEHPWRALVKHGQEVPSTMHPRATDFVTGCAMVISREAIHRVGGLALCYFPAYFEDGDYCHRVRNAGFKVMYAPRPIVFHKVGSTVRAANLGRELLYHKNRLRVVYVRRNYRGVARVAALGYLAITKPARALLETIRGRPRDGWAVASGALNGFLTRELS